ncbi:hypothetical protein ARMSODRAFT_115855 [Armillaria solidipes]|uniref:Uncharacterized protein n=1 Tax=Armillaria solidipes TaxID=1076256 RepID=A0A2H3BI08_9AGAR|nr:hypothetical protein ARMSODRAFT_115855 [Armillaria solidipes]
MIAGAVQDTLKLGVRGIGPGVEKAGNDFVDSRFSQEDYTYDWLMHFLLQVGTGSYQAQAESDFTPPPQQSALGWSRELETTTRCSQNDLTQSTDENDPEDGTLVHDRDGRQECRVPFIRDIGTYS